MKNISFFLLFLFLASCSPISTSTPNNVQEVQNKPILQKTIHAEEGNGEPEDEVPLYDSSPTIPVEATDIPVIIQTTLEVCVEVHSLSVRTGPGTNFDKVGYLKNDECITLIDRTKDGRWTRFEGGWVGTYFLASDEEIKTLPIFGETPEENETISTTITLLPTELKQQPSPTYKPTSTRKPTNTPYVRPPTATPRIESDTIPWNEARYYYGEYKTVCGKVVDSNYVSTTSGQPTFLNLGRPYPDSKRFTVIIWGRNRGNFPTNPENYYYAKNICVKGLIENYKGSAQIEATSSSQIMAQ